MAVAASVRTSPIGNDLKTYKYGDHWGGGVGSSAGEMREVEDSDGGASLR